MEQYPPIRRCNPDHDRRGATAVLTEARPLKPADLDGGCQHFGNNPLEPHAVEAAEFFTDHQDVAACERLWRTVINRARLDLRFLEHIAGRVELAKHERERLRRIQQNPPAEFIEGAWFEQVCEYLRVDAGELRRELVA